MSLTVSENIIAGLRVLSTKAQDLQAPAQSITIVNGPLLVIGQGPFPPIISGLADVVAAATALSGPLQGSKHVTTQADATAVANATREYVLIMQALLNILIGKAGLLSVGPLIGDKMVGHI